MTYQLETVEPDDRPEVQTPLCCDICGDELKTGKQAFIERDPNGVIEHALCLLCF